MKNDPFKKLPATRDDKIFAVTSLRPEDENALSSWIKLYFQTHVLGGSKNTTRSKQNDFKLFLAFFLQGMGADQIDLWTPAITKTFVRDMKKKYAATSVNRMLATLRHFAKWVDSQRPFLAGNPFAGVKDLSTDEPDWNGLTPTQLMRLRGACDQRLKSCDRKDQNPFLEVAVFYILLYTGLREFELCSLKVSQYHHRGFHQVQRKGQKVAKKIPLPKEAAQHLDTYLEDRKKRNDDQPLDPKASLLVGRRGQPITTSGVYKICQRICNLANVGRKDEELIHLTPHKLRHTFLKKIADKEGVHIAQKFSGNISMREVFRYTQPSADEMQQIVEDIF